MNKRRPGLDKQRGATLIIGLIMLVMLSLIVTTSFTMSTTNLKAVGNMQIRDEVIAAANAALEERISAFALTSFSTPPTATSAEVDSNNDGAVDYVATVTPTCVRATVADSGTFSSLSLGGMTASGTWYTIWDFAAEVEDAATGAAVNIHSGVRVKLSDSQKNIACP